MAGSKVPLRKWVIAIYMCSANLESVSSMKLHRELGVTQKTAWYLLQRLREAWGPSNDKKFNGSVEADETYFGGKRKNRSKAKRSEQTGRGTSGKMAVVGVKDRGTKRVRARVVETTDRETLQGFVKEHAA